MFFREHVRKEAALYFLLYVNNLRIFLVFRQNENPTAEREGGEQAGWGSQEGFKQAQEASHEVQDDEENHVHASWRRYQSMYGVAQSIE